MALNMARLDASVRMEGTLTKRAMKSGRNWKKRYFVLKNNAMIYYDEKPTEENDKERRPKGLVEVTSRSVVRASPVNKPFAFELLTRPQLLCVHADSKEQQQQWMAALEKVIQEIKADRALRSETRRGWLVKRALRSGRNWKKRFFVLRNGRLSYYEQPPSGPSDKPKGLIEVTAVTTVRPSGSTMGWGKKHGFVVSSGSKTMHLSAESDAERLAWMNAMHLSALRKAEVTTDAAVRIGLWLRRNGFEKYVAAVVHDGGIDSLDKLRRITEDDLKALFRHGKFTMNAARRFQAELRDLRAMKSADVEAYGDIKASKRSTLFASPAAGDSTNQADEGDSFLGDALGEEIMVRESLVVRPSFHQAKEQDTEHRLYTWGDDSELQLGIGSSSGGMSTEPVYVKALKHKTEPYRVYAGGTSMAAISFKEGNLFTWGSGPLGLHDKTQSNRPYLVTSLRSVRVVTVSVGERQMGAVTDVGDLYMWGMGEFGELGLGPSRFKAREPVLVEGVGVAAGLAVASLCCSSQHTMILTENGKIFAMGKGRHGRLGVGDEENRFVPTIVDNLGGHRITKIEAGDTFSIALSANGVACYWWGKLAGRQGPPVPMRLDQFDERCIDDISAAGNVVAFVVGVQDDGNDVTPSSVYTMGSDGDLLGHGDDIPRDRPTLVRALEGHGIIKVSCSSTHAAALSDDGRLLMWGHDERGQLGNGMLSPIPAPHAAMIVAGFRYKWVSCGTGTTATITSFDPRFGQDLVDPDRFEIGAPVAPPPPAGAQDMSEEALEARRISQMMHELDEVSQFISGVIDSDVETDDDSTAGLGSDNGDDEEVDAAPEEPKRRAARRRSSRQPQRDDSLSGFAIPPPPPPILPEGSRVFAHGWLEHTDRSTGKKYYENMATKTVQWNPPSFLQE